MNDLEKMPGHLIRRAQQISTAFFAEECGAFDLTSVQYAALVAIDARPGLDAMRLSALIAFDRSTIGDVLARIENKGLVVRTADPSDKRIKLLRTTAEGRAVLDRMRPAITKVQERLLAPFTPRDRTAAMDLLNRLANPGDSGPTAVKGGVVPDDRWRSASESSPCTYANFQIGSRYRSDMYLIEKSAIIAFASEFDPQPQHMGEAAGESQFGELVASGWHTAAASMRLFLEALPPIAGGMQGVATEDLTWPRSVRAGDELSIDVEVVWKRESQSRADKGLVKFKALTLNQAGEIVQTVTHLVTMRRESAGTVCRPVQKQNSANEARRTQCPEK